MSGKGDTWMPLYIADYLRDTTHLTAEQHGVYLLLLMAAWTRGGRLPVDAGQLAAIARVPPATWRRISPLILEFFSVDGVHLVQKRLTDEVAKAQRLSEARRASGQKGGRPSKQNESKPEPIGFQDHNLNGKQNETPARVALPSPDTTYLSEPNGSGRRAPIAEPDQDLDRRAWAEGVRLLMSQSGVSERSARAFFGKVLSDNSLIPRQLLPALATVEITASLDPQAYLTKAAKGVGRPRAAVDVLAMRSNIQ